MNYLEAHRRTMESVTGTILSLAHELNEYGCKVYLPHRTNKTFLRATKDGKQIHIEFAETPHRWILYIDIDPKSKRGSTSTLETRGGKECSFSAIEMIDRMVDDVPGSDKRNSYLEL